MLLRCSPFLIASTTVVTALMVTAVSLPGAQACSPPSCDGLVELPPVGARFMADAVGFHVAGPPTKGDTSGLEIQDGQGAKIPAGVKLTAGRWVYGPDAPLAPGVYYLVYDKRCFPKDGSAPRTKVPTDLGALAFGVEPAGAMPTRTGELTIEERGTSGSPPEGHFVRLRARLADDVYPRSAGAFISLSVDGEPFGGQNRLSIADPLVITLECGADWRKDSCGLNNTVPPGKRRIELTARLVGSAASLAPATLELDVCAEAGARPDAGTTAVDAGLLPDAAVDSVPPPASRSGGGCALAGGPHSALGSAGSIGLLIVAVLFLRRRRSRSGA